MNYYDYPYGAPATAPFSNATHPGFPVQSGGVMPGVQAFGRGGAATQYAAPAHAPAPTAAAVAPQALNARAAPAQPFFNMGNDRFMRGLLIGAAAAYLLTNEDVQRTVIKSAVKVWSSVQGGIEEAKERFRDAEAEIQAAVADKHP